MKPQQQRDLSGLRWIRADLEQTLREARSALEAFVEGQGERIADGIERLHHVHGALEVIQVYGGSLLADEMEQVAKALSALAPDAVRDALRDGDRFFYTGDTLLQSNDVASLIDFSTLTLTDILAWNTAMTGMPTSFFMGGWYRLSAANCAMWSRTSWAVTIPVPVATTRCCSG